MSNSVVSLPVKVQVIETYKTFTIQFRGTKYVNQIEKWFGHGSLV